MTPTIPYPEMDEVTPRIRSFFDFSSGFPGGLIDKMYFMLAYGCGWSAIAYHSVARIFAELVPTAPKIPISRQPIFDDYITIGNITVKFMDPRIDVPPPTDPAIWVVKGINYDGSFAGGQAAILGSFSNLLTGIMHSGAFESVTNPSGNLQNILAITKTSGPGSSGIHVRMNSFMGTSEDTWGGGYRLSHRPISSHVLYSVVILVGQDQLGPAVWVEFGNVGDSVIVPASVGRTDLTLFASPYQFYLTKLTETDGVTLNSIMLEALSSRGGAAPCAYYLPGFPFRRGFASTEVYVNYNGAIYFPLAFNGMRGWSFAGYHAYGEAAAAVNGGPMLFSRFELTDEIKKYMYKPSWVAVSLGAGSFCNVVGRPWNTFYRTGAVPIGNILADPGNTNLPDPNNSDKFFMALHSNPGGSPDTQGVIWMRVPAKNQMTANGSDFDYDRVLYMLNHDGSKVPGAIHSILNPEPPPGISDGGVYSEVMSIVS